MLTFIIAVAVICILLYYMDVPNRLRVYLLKTRVENYCCRTADHLKRAQDLLITTEAAWDNLRQTTDGIVPLNATQELEKSRELSCIWDHIRHVEEVQTRNARCKNTLDEMMLHYPALDFREPNNKLMLDLVARDVDVQGWSLDGLCGGTTTQWW